MSIESSRGIAKLGVTATRMGGSILQLEAARSWMTSAAIAGPIPSEFHHGDCKGGDAQLYAIAASLGYRLHCHPPLDDADRAFTHNDVDYAPLGYMPRNREIVAMCDLLLVMPRDMVRRDDKFCGGTWKTYAHAVKVRRPRVVVWPNGQISEEGLQS